MTVDNEREGLKVLFYVPQEPFFLREIMTENLHFFHTFSNRHNTRLRTFFIFCRRKIGVCRSEPHNGLQNTGRSTCSDQVHWRGRPQPQAALLSYEEHSGVGAQESGSGAANFE